MKFPLIASLPHVGTEIPEEVRDQCILSHEDIVRDGDEGAWEVYYGLQGKAAAFQTTSVARAIVDLNRAQDDISRDGVVKTHTVYDQPIYEKPLTEDLIARLIERYWKPYHGELSSLANSDAVVGLDCHTMLAVGPPVGPDAGKQRPAVCLSNNGGTCPEEWIKALASCCEDAFGAEVQINDPFKGGYIIRSHFHEMPWLQLEISRGDFMGNDEKGNCLMKALEKWCQLDALKS